MADKLSLERYAVIARLYLDRYLRGGYRVGSLGLGKKIVDLKEEVVSYAQ
jgi:hypothetical protein